MAPHAVPGEARPWLRLGSLTRWLWVALWMVVVLALALRAARLPELPGSYPEDLDGLLYGGARLLRGELLHADFVTGQGAITQFLYALSAQAGSLRLHRLLIVGVDGLGGLLLARSLGYLAQAGWIRWRRHSPLPVLAGGLYVVINQCVPDGAAGLPPHFANLFLALALATACYLGVRPPGSRACLPGLLGLGGWLGLAMATRPALALPLLTLLALAPFVLGLRPPLVPLLAGLLVGLVLPSVPCLLRPGGVALAWSGEVLLPLLAVDPGTAPVRATGPILLQALSTPVAGLPLGSLLVLPLGAWLASRWPARQRPAAARPGRMAALAALSLVFGLLLMETLRRDGLQRAELAFLAFPLVLLTVLGLGALETDARPWPRRLALACSLILSLLLFNNLAVASLLHPPRKPAESVRALEQDRARLADYLASLPPRERGFTAPQDVALQRRLNVPATTRGIGPRWSLDQQHLGQHWASRVLGLPADANGACGQLTAARNRHLVWSRIDPSVANSLDFFRSCLAREGDKWEDITARLGLVGGEMKLFRRLPP
ncbi:MAG: hypothetical protein ACK5Q6_06925 [Cyanobacteriota bacterium]